MVVAHQCIRRISIIVFVFNIFISFIDVAESSNKMELDEEKSGLQRQNQELKEKLQKYQALEEDLMAARVFEKARKQLTIYITLGGIVLILGGLIGIKSLIDYAKNLAKAKIDAVTDDQIKMQLQKEGERQITVLIKRQEANIARITRQQIESIILSTQPIGQTKVAPEQQVETRLTLDYTNEMPSVRNTGNEGSTVGFATAAALSYQIQKRTGEKVTISPRYIYYYARSKGGFPTNQDSGANIRDAIKVLLEVGAVAEEVWPYKAGEFAQKPPKEVEQAVHHKIRDAQLVRNVADLKGALQRYGPVVAGVTIFQLITSSDIAKTGVIPMPGKSDQIIGAKAICIMGFDDERQLLKFQNDWGTGWGDKGYGYISYEYFNRFLAEAWWISI